MNRVRRLPIRSSGPPMSVYAKIVPFADGSRLAQALGRPTGRFATEWRDL